MRLQVANSTTTVYYSVTNAVPAKPYLPIASGANTYYLPFTTATLAGIKLKAQSGNATYRACIYQSGYYNTTSSAVGNLSSTTALTRASTSATLTRASTSATLTRASTSATLTRSSISGYATGSSTVNYTIVGYTKVTTNINGSQFATSNYNMSVHRYNWATYLENAVAGYHVSGHVIVERDFAWNMGGYKTSAGNDFNKASYKFSGQADYPTFQLESTNGRPKMWLWQANTTNTANTKSTISDIGQMPYGNTMWTFYDNTITGTSVSRAFSWTTFFFTNLATSSNQTLQIGGITSASVVWFNNIFRTVTTRTSSIQIPNLFRSSYPVWKTLTVTSVNHFQYREARVRETINTSSTKQVTTATLTRSSISGYATRSSASGYQTRSSISGYGTRSSISGYATRSSISGYGTRASTSGYSGKLSSSTWA